MNLTLTEDQELIQDTARKFLHSRMGSANIRSMSNDPKGFSQGLWDEITEQGWVGLMLPQAYGGSGSGFFETCLLAEQLGWHAVPSPFVPTVLGGLVISQFGTPAQKDEWLPSICQGRIVSYVPPASLGQWADSESSVIATRTGNQIRLDGSAFFVPFAHVASEILIAAKWSSHEDSKHVVLLLDQNAPGLVQTAVETVGSDRPHHLELTGVVVPETRILGAGDKGSDVLNALLTWGASATAVQMAGSAQRVLDLSVEYVRQRQQFGRPIGSFQAVQHHCANMAIDVLTARFLAYEAAWRLSAGLSADTEVSMAKAWTSDSYRRVMALAHQVHGAIGFTKDHDLHFFLRDALAASVQFGESDVHWDRIASLLGL